MGTWCIDCVKNTTLLYFVPNIVLLMIERNSENKLSVHIGRVNNVYNFNFIFIKQLSSSFFQKKQTILKSFFWISDNTSNSRSSRILGKSLLKEVLKNQCLSFWWQSPWKMEKFTFRILSDFIFGTYSILSFVSSMGWKELTTETTSPNTWCNSQWSGCRMY